MGDYTKLIVSCVVSKDVKEELDVQLKELGLYCAAYHSQESTVSVTENTNGYSKTLGHLNLIAIGQTKSGNGQDEFLNWLSPHVKQGSGEADVFAMQFTEYSVEPRLWAMGEGIV